MNTHSDLTALPIDEAHHSGDGRSSDVTVPFIPDRQAEILKFLLTHRRRVVTRDEIARVLGGPGISGSRAPDILISRLRRNLADRGFADVIRTVRGVGYRLESELYGMYPVELAL